MNFAVGLCGWKGVFTLQELVFDSMIPQYIMVRKNSELGNHYNWIKTTAKENNIKIYLEDEPVEEEKGIPVFYIGWQRIINNITGNEFIIHDSYLPLLSGFCPTVQALINGDKVLSSTMFLPTAKMDSGPIVNKTGIMIEYPIKIFDAIKLVAQNNLNLIKDYFYYRARKNIKINENDRTYSCWRDQLDYNIDWTQPADKIQRFIHAVGYPYEGAKTKYYANEKYANSLCVRVKDAEYIPGKVSDAKLHAGKPLYFEDEHPVVVCGEGLLKLTHLYHAHGDFKLKRLKVRL